MRANVRTAIRWTWYATLWVLLALGALSGVLSVASAFTGVDIAFSLNMWERPTEKDFMPTRHQGVDIRFEGAEIELTGYRAVLSPHWETADVLSGSQLSIYDLVTYHETTLADHQAHIIMVKAWIPPTVIGAIIGLVYLRSSIIPAYRRRHRQARGLCLSCGYDLRGNQSGRCPECGVTAEPSAADRV